MKETYIPSSSNLDQVSYDSDKQLLTITFKDGRSYEYTSVPQDVYMQLQRAPSAGSYFMRQIKNSYAYTEV